MRLLLSKTKEGGFINESYEKLNRIAGYVAVVLILCTFIALVSLIFFPPDNL